MIKKITRTMGFGSMEPPGSPFTYNCQDYGKDTTIDLTKAQTHRDYIKGLNDEETKRLDTIESKTGQMVSQTSIVFSLLSLFVPLLVDKMDDFAVLSQVVIIIVLLLSFFFYLVAIRNALKNFLISDFIYSNPSPANILDHQNDTVEQFMVMEIRDLLYSINQNTKTNNKKATNLIHSYNAFQMGNLLTAILVTGFCCTFFISSFRSKETQVVQVNIRSNDTIAVRAIGHFPIGLPDKQAITIDTIIISSKNADTSGRLPLRPQPAEVSSPRKLHK